jgi:hypothetical protein
MRTRAALAILVVPFIAACGATAKTNKTNQTGGSTVSAAPSGPSNRSINKAFWSDGFKVTLSDASVVKPPKPSPGYSIPRTRLMINATFENLGPDNDTPYNLDLVVQSGTNSYLDHDSQDEKIPQVPGLQRTQGVIAFFVDDKFNLGNAILLVGNARNNQAQVPLGSSGKYVPLEPQKVAVSGTINISGAFTLAVSGGELSYDDAKSHQEEKSGDVLLQVHFAATGNRDNSCCLGTDNLILKLPDGTAVAAHRNSTVSIPGSGLTTPDETAEWVFKAADGSYDMIVKGAYGPSGTSLQADLPFSITLGVSATSSGTPPAGGSFPSPTPSGPEPTPSGH